MEEVVQIVGDEEEVEEDDSENRTATNDIHLRVFHMDMITDRYGGREARGRNAQFVDGRRREEGKRRRTDQENE